MKKYLLISALFLTGCIMEPAERKVYVMKCEPSYPTTDSTGTHYTESFCYLDEQ